MESVYDSVPLARAMLRGSFSDSSQASTAPIVPSKLSHVLSPSSSPNAHSSNQRRLSIDSARSVSPEWENSIPSPGIPLLEWIARQTAREEAERRIAEQRGSVEAEEEDDEMEDGDRYDLDRRSPGTPTVDDALMYFARPDAPPARPTITLSASSAAVYGSTHSATTKSPTHRSSRSPETRSSYSATGRLYHPPSSKPFKCPTEGCDKAYKQQNGLKYHLKHGKCSNDPEVLAKEGDPTSGDKKRFACHSEECNKKYKNLNGLRYHYQHSGAHGMLGMQLLRQGHHPPWGPTASARGSDQVQEQEEEEDDAESLREQEDAE